MPDPGFPYNDPTGSFNPGAQQYQIPNPAQQMLDYSYLQNNQNIMNMNQSSLQQTLQTAQFNFHRDMQSVLQGSMAAGMAIYNVGKSAIDKAKEHQYQDTLLGGGNYVLQRSALREMEWSSGLAGSDFGRAFKIGGRRPEFMSQAELQMQLGRSWEHRKEEWSIEAGGGLVGAASSGVGLMGGASLAGGVFGLVAGQTMGRAYDVLYADPRRYKENFRKISEQMDLQGGVGQRRFTKGVSDNVMDSFYSEERHPLARLTPFVGDYLADRLAPDTKVSEFLPKMMQQGLFRDTDLNDVEGIKKQIKDTVSFVEKFAGIAHVTKDAILQLKGTLERSGLSDNAQNAMVSNITKASLSTGMTFESVAGMSSQYQQFALLTGLNKSVTTSSGLTELSQIKALQEAGLIDRGYDAGTLAMNRTQRSHDYGKTGAGQVGYFGHGSVGKTAEFFAKNGGGGSTPAGWFLNTLGLNHYGIDENKQFAETAREQYNKFLNEKGANPQEALTKTMVYMQVQPGDREGGQQVYDALFNDKMGKNLATAGMEDRLFNNTGREDLITSFNVKGVEKTGINSWLFGASDSTLNSLSGTGGLLTQMKSSKNYDTKTKKYKNFSTKYEADIQKIYGYAYDNNSNAAKASINTLVKRMVENGDASSEEDAKRLIYTKMEQFDSYNKGWHFKDLDPESIATGAGHRGSIESLHSTMKNRLFDSKNVAGMFSHTTDSELDVYKKPFDALANNSKYKDLFENFYNSIDTSSGANNSKQVNELLAGLKKRGVDVSSFEKLANSTHFIRDPLSHHQESISDNGESITRLFSTFVQGIKREGGQDRLASANFFSNLVSTQGSKYGAGSGKMNYAQYMKEVQQFGDTISALRKKDYKSANAWLNANAAGFQKLISDVYGDDELAKQTVLKLRSDSNAGPSNWKDTVDSPWMQAPTIAGSYSEAEKELGPGGKDPAVAAISDFTIAIKALTKALS